MASTSTESSNLRLQTEADSIPGSLSTYLQLHISNKATPNPSQMVSPTEDQVLRHMSLWGSFSFMVPQWAHWDVTLWKIRAPSSQNLLCCRLSRGLASCIFFGKHLVNSFTFSSSSLPSHAYFPFRDRVPLCNYVGMAGLETHRDPPAFAYAMLKGICHYA